MLSLITMSSIIGAIAVPASAGIYSVTSGIGSWYRASASQDSTTGKSWCGYPYSNSDPVFAVSLKAMGAKVTDPITGNIKLMYISPGSIDIITDAFAAIHGNPNGDKNIVIKGVK
ncbi:hypothetical protein PSV09DRAFT_2373913 [Bipolaris maydis]|nr:hypothetical protein PSV09DRAFT_2373913 [Bipolaris maydis]